MHWLKSTWGQLNEHPRRALYLLFALCLAAYLATIPLPRVDGMLIGSDGIGYYMYVRSLVIDHDLDFANEYARLRPAIDVAQVRTATGLVGNQYAIGPGILWSPFFAAAHLIVLGLQHIGLKVVADGYGYAYQAAVCVGSIVYGSLGLLLIHRVVERYYARTALAVAVLICLATNVIYYLIAEPSMSHMCSLFAVALLVDVWTRSRPAFCARRCLEIGLVGGLVGIVRQPDATLLALPVLDLVLRHGATLNKLKRVGIIVVGFVAVLAIQMWAWKVLNGSYLTSGYFLDPSQGFHWLSPRLLDVLFSTEHGLFLWHPILLIAVVGLALAGTRDGRLPVLLFGGIAIQAYLIASWSSWSQGDAFGGRMFIGTLPLFAYGLAASLRWALAKRLGPAVWALGVLLVLWNGLFVLQYRLGFIPMSGPYTLQQLTVGKFEMLSDLARRVMALMTG